MFDVNQKIYFISTNDKKVLHGTITMKIISENTGYIMYGIMSTDKESFNLNECFLFHDKDNAEANLNNVLEANKEILELGNVCLDKQNAIRDALVGKPELSKGDVVSIFGVKKGA